MDEKILFVSIIIPCRNEKNFIGQCLESIVNQNYPKEYLEVLVVDGLSDDGTKETIKTYLEKYPFIKLFENSNKYTSFGLNIGIKNAKGEIIVRMDAHAEYGEDYVSQCLKYLEQYKVDNIGGIIKTLPSQKDIWAKAIALVLSHFFGAGNSYFRIGLDKPRLVDTVFGGCYKKEVFEKIGLFNEKLIRSQDIEFNQRLRGAGGKILLVSEIKVNYYPQANFSDFFKHNFNDGIWTIYPLKFGIRFFSWRHLVPLFFVMSLVILLVLSFFSIFFLVLFFTFLILYLLTDFFFSLLIAVGEKDLRLLFVLFLTFINRHFGYGLGSAWALFKLI